MRPVWNGGISFGLIYIPVKLYSAVESVELDLDLLDERDKSPIRYARINESSGEEVPWKEVVKGFEVSKGRYVVLEDADFEKAAVEKTENIDIVCFVDADEINPKYFEKPYYLEPTKPAKKTYALLREALKKSNKVGIAEFVMRGREHLVALQPEKDVLMLMQMRYSSEIRDPQELDVPSAKADLNDKELDLAENLIENMTEKFDAKDYKDDYILELKKLIQAKAKHKKYKVKEAEKHVATEIPNLMEQLRKSLEEAK